MEKLLIEVILNPVLKRPGPQTKTTTFKLVEFIEKVFLNQNSHLSFLEKVSIISKVLAANSDQPPRKMSLHNEILRQQINFT